jgi:hypothetical protein
MLLSGGVGVAASSARAHPTLPAISPQRLVADVIRTAERPPPVSGMVDTHVDLGLPTFPVQGPPGAPGATGIAGLLSEVTGDHRVRLWSSRDGYRADELLPASERGLYVSRQGGWLWSSDAYTAYELFDAKAVAALGPAAAAGSAERSELMHLGDPLTLARDALAAASPTTSVSIGPSIRVAGRPAYVLTLTPKDPGTLVGRVELGIDANTRVPLSAAVFARRAASPAISVRFSAVSYGAIPPAIYRFTPPPGAKVMELYQAGRPPPGRLSEGSRTDGPTPARVFGTGWSTAVGVRIPASQLGPASSPGGADIRRFFPFSGPLFSIRLVPRGDQVWLLAGPVPQAVLAGLERQLP